MVTTWPLRFANHTLKSGGVIAYPTETVFGLGCDPENELAVTRLLDFKNRSWEKGLILIAADIEQLRPYIELPGKNRMLEITKSWPGPTTWVFRASTNVPIWVRGIHATIAVRVTPHPLAAALCRLFKRPLVSTSANLSGHAPIRRRIQLQHWFGDVVDYILPGEVGPYLKPSEIRDAQPNRVLRT